MRLTSSNYALLTGLAAAFAVGFGGCDGSSTGGSGGGINGQGAMNVTMVDGPSANYQAINVNVKEIDVEQVGVNGKVWITLGQPNKVLDLLKLRAGVSASLALDVALGIGHYDKIRLILGDGCTIQLADGSIHPLDISAELQAGLLIDLDVDISVGNLADIYLDFDANASIQVIVTGGVTTYKLCPVLRAVDKALTGSISGVLTVGPTGAAVAGAVVFAETLDAQGRASIVRSAITAADGSYTLDLLPLGQTYYVVCLPLLASINLDAKASAAIALSLGATVNATWSAALDIAASVGAVAGTLSPMASGTESDHVDLLEQFNIGGASVWLIVASLCAELDATENFNFALVQSGNYALQADRLSIDANAAVNVSLLAPSKTFAVLDVTATLDLSF